MSIIWQTKRIGNLCSVVSGNGFPKKFQGGVSGIYPFLKVSDMNLSGNEKLMNLSNNYVDEQ